MPTIDPSSLGNLIIELGYCTAGQIQEGLTTLNGSGLGEALIGLGHLTRYQLEWVLTRQGIDRKQVGGAQANAFMRKQLRGLAKDLHEGAIGVRALTAKINGKS